MVIGGDYWLVVDVVYYGNFFLLIDISFYKYDGFGGVGVLVNVYLFEFFD